MEAQARAVHRHQEGAVFGPGTTDGEQPFQFPATVNLGAMGLATDPGQEPLELIRRPVEHQVKEATEGTDRLVERTGRQVPDLDQVQDIVLEFLVGDSVG